MNRKVRIALTKGRIESKAVELLDKIGYDTSELKNKGRRLILSIPNEDIEVVLAKAADVITYVEHGVCDIG
ncbi:MAG: ATP phosphoribosyltransferase, partial [Oscillospiraceae bacterium]|nr:ATP phosphoribosyltransferase [Oscillospiraceae bacterium]